MSRPLPQRSWDCHAHVFGDPDRYPPAPERDYDPPHAPLDAYVDMLDRHGIAHGVLVQPSVYGFDNRCLLDALDRAEGRLLGVAVPAPDTTVAELEDMHRRGVRGVRCNLLNANGLQPEAVLAWQPVMADLGWHVAFQVEVEGIADLHSWLEPITVSVVIDHMGRPRPGSVDPASPGLRRLVNAVAEGACFVKLSAPYRLSHSASRWSDITPLARALLDANPAACLWASDWPHVDTATPVATADLFNALQDWCPQEGQMRQLMAEAPSRLFGTP